MEGTELAHTLGEKKDGTAALELLKEQKAELTQLEEDTQKKMMNWYYCILVCMIIMVILCHFVFMPGIELVWYTAIPQS